MGFWHWLTGVLGRGEAPAWRTRLSAAQAIELARSAVAANPLRDQLSMTTVTERDGVLIWSISAPVIGQNLVVEIDDRTGTVIRSFTEGVR